MSLAAVDDLEDALEATKRFLWPFDAGRWLRLAVIAFFVSSAGGAGGGAGGNTGSSGADVGSLPALDARTLPPVAVSDAVVAAVLALVVLLLLLALAFAVVGAVLEFVLVESLREEAVHLRRYFRRYWRGGLRLFGFRLGVSVLTVAVILVTLGVGVLAAGGIDAIDTPLRLLAAVLVVLPVVAVVAVLGALVLGLTTDFVVPVMLLEGTTVLGGWRRFWPTLRADWAEYVVYVLLTFVLRLVAGVAVGFVVLLAALVLVVPLGLVAVAGLVATGGELGLAAIAGLLVLGLVAVLVLVAVSAVVQVPVMTYFRYYALLLLGDTEPAFDLVADRRAAIRSEASET